MTDVRSVVYTSSPAFVTLDNFKPYIKAVNFRAVPHAGAQPVLQYSRKWVCNGDCITLSGVPSPSVSKSDWYNLLNPASPPILELRVTPSEPLNSLKLDLVYNDGSDDDDIIANGLTPDSSEGEDLIFNIGAYIYDLNGLVTFRFSGKDHSGNELLAFTAGHQAPNACVKVPTRSGSGANSWNDNIAGGYDNTHAICIDCGPNFVSPNCVSIVLVDDGEECLEVSATVIDASSPGQADGKVSLDISGGVPPYDIYWADGSSATGLHEAQIADTGHNFELDCSRYPSGSYFITFWDKNRSLAGTRKIIKK